MSENQIDKSIGGRIQELLSVLGIRQRPFALAIRMDQSQLSKVINGERGLTMEKAVDISSTYKVSLNWLIAGVGQMWILDKDKGSDETSRQERDEDVIIKLKRTELEALQTSFEILAQAFSGLLHSGKEKYDPSVEVLSLGKKGASGSKSKTLGGT